ncbi:hypothetical protein AALK14_21225 [Butyricimonas hominis]|uniref:hypothetical protein n=1 Tax=Butyricimonas TaxID=574697 RepID=UPI003511FE84
MRKIWIFLTCFMLAVNLAYGQSWGEKIIKKAGKRAEERAKQKVEDKVNKKVDKTVDDAFDEAGNAVKGNKDKKDKTEKKEEVKVKPVATKAESGQRVKQGPRGPVKRTEIGKILPSESIDVAESSGGVLSGGGEISIAVYNAADRSFYIYKDGKRTGPYTKSEMKAQLPADRVKYMNANVTRKVRASQKPLQDGYVVEGGKKYGPLEGELYYLYENEDKSAFIAVVYNMNAPLAFVTPLAGVVKTDKYMQYDLEVLTNEGGKVLLLSIPLTSTNPQKQMEKQMEYNQIQMEKMKPIIDLTKKMQGASTEEQMKVVAEIKRKKEEIEKELKEIAPDQLVFEKYIYTLDGKGYGPYAKDAMICFSRSGGEHWAAMFNGTLRIDGVEMQVPGGIYPTSDILWISPDGQRFALKEYDKIAFSDGKEYPYPMHVTYENGELIWLCMENKESIVRYSLDF